MADFAQRIDNKYGTATYQDTKNTYDWIMKAIEKMNFYSVKTSFGFYMGDISCFCNSIEEFIAYAYGQANYSFIAMNFTVESEESLSISVDYDTQIRISAKSKNLLERTATSLKNTALNEFEINDSISVTYVNQQHVETLVGGNNNIVANDNSSVVAGNNNSIGQSNKESLIKQWFSAIGQNLISNGIWYVLCIVGGIVIARLAT